jgi:TolB protein
MTTNHTNLDDATIRHLEQILAFDLDHNGATFVSKKTAENDQLGQSGSVNQLGSTIEWKERHIAYVVKPQVQGETLSLLVLDVHKQTLKSTDSFPLTGNLSQDRKQVHRAADVVYKALFGDEGIASTKILYTIKTTDPLNPVKTVSEVWECDYDGGNPKQLTFEGSTCVTPVYLPPKPGYTPGGFLYVSYILGQPKIYAASLKDCKGKRLTYLSGNQLMPAISHQRDKIAFISDVTGNPDLFLQQFDPEQGVIGKPQQIFSARQATQGTPTFSPDGSRIAFVSNKDGSPKIYVIDIPEPGARLKDVKTTLISKSNRENTAPSWSPDGTKLAYCSRNWSDRQIWVYNFSTNQEMQLTQGPGHKENPSWAPNSLHLVYNTTDPKSGNLFIINLHQPEEIKITSGDGEKRYPNWEPRIKATLNESDKSIN